MEKPYHEKIADALINQVFIRCGKDSPHNSESNSATIMAHAKSMAGDLKSAAIEAGKTDLSLEMWESAVNSVPDPVLKVA